MPDHRKPTDEEIRARAYELYAARGGEEGQHDSDWLRAEKELTEASWIENGRAMSAAAGAGAGATGSGAREREPREQGEREPDEEENR